MTNSQIKSISSRTEISPQTSPISQRTTSTLNSRDTVKSIESQNRLLQCRWCLESLLLERVCGCQHPSLSHAHEDCLYSWLRLSNQYYCELCKLPFTLALPTAQTNASSISSVNSVLSNPNNRRLATTLRSKLSHLSRLWDLYQDSEVADELNLLGSNSIDLIIILVIILCLLFYENFSGIVFSRVVESRFIWFCFWLKVIVTRWQWWGLLNALKLVKREHFTETPVEKLQAKMEAIQLEVAFKKQARSKNKLKLKKRKVIKDKKLFKVIKVKKVAKREGFSVTKSPKPRH